MCPFLRNVTVPCSHEIVNTDVYRKHGEECTEQFYRQHVLDETSLRKDEDKAAAEKQKQALVEILKRDRLLREPDLFLTEQGEQVCRTMLGTQSY